MTSPVSMPAGHAILAPDLDAYENLTGVWLSYTPTWSSDATQPVLNNGASTGKYVRYGKTCVTAGRIAPGSTTTFGTGSYSFSLPFTAAGNMDAIGSAVILDAGTTRYAANFYIIAGSSVGNIVYGSLNFMSPTSPFTLASDDTINWQILYEVA